jgi:hypothetical protein
MKLSDAKHEVQQEAWGIHHQYVTLLEQRQTVAGSRYEGCCPGTPRVGLYLRGRYFRVRFWYRMLRRGPDTSMMIFAYVRPGRSIRHTLSLTVIAGSRALCCSD